MAEPDPSNDDKKQIPEDDSKQPADTADTGTSTITQQKVDWEGNSHGFPQRLLQMLNDEENQPIVSWLPHGKGWVIHNKQRFSDFILPKYFKKSKFTSFTRKLNRWNFTRVTRGPETGAYYHPLFVRDNPRLSMQMSCISSKTAQNVQPMDPVALGLGTYFAPYDKDTMAAFYAFQQNQYMMFMAQQQQLMAAAKPPEAAAVPTDETTPAEKIGEDVSTLHVKEPPLHQQDDADETAV